jgi:hypothetical protein
LLFIARQRTTSFIFSSSSGSGSAGSTIDSEASILAITPGDPSRVTFTEGREAGIHKGSGPYEGLEQKIVNGLAIL